MVLAVALTAFVAVVAGLTALNSRRTRGRACCAPADPTHDLRMSEAADAPHVHDPEHR